MRTPYCTFSNDLISFSCNQSVKIVFLVLRLHCIVSPFYPHLSLLPSKIHNWNQQNCIWNRKYETSTIILPLSWKSIDTIFHVRIESYSALHVFKQFVIFATEPLGRGKLLNYRLCVIMVIRCLLQMSTNNNSSRCSRDANALCFAGWIQQHFQWRKYSTRYLELTMQNDARWMHHRTEPPNKNTQWQRKRKSKQRQQQTDDMTMAVEESMKRVAICYC